MISSPCFVWLVTFVILSLSLAVLVLVLDGLVLPALWLFVAALLHVLLLFDLPHVALAVMALLVCSGNLLVVLMP